MKIAEIVCTFPPYRGGMGNSVRNLAEYLVREGHEVTVFTPNYSNLSSEEDGIFKLRRLHTLLKFGNAAYMANLGKNLKSYDAIHIHLPFLGATFRTLIFCLFHPKKKLLVTYHMDLVGQGFKKYIFLAYCKLVLPLVLLWAKKIFISSFDYAEHSDIAGFFKKHKNKFVEIPFGIDAEKFYPRDKDTALLEKYFIGREDKVILFVGGLDRAHYFKGLPILLRALKNIIDSGRDNIRLLIVGSGEMQAEYKDMAHALGIADKAIFAEDIADADLSAYYNLADVFVLPSITRSEAFGIVLLEAASCGKPLIASDLAGVRTLVHPEENGFRVKPGDANDLSEKILKILDDDDLRRKMGERSRQMVLAGYTLEKMAKKTGVAI